ncbi:nitroreductase [Stappia sp. GBMRC 2046]|uniref:Putative NAD(P)H nitroreductase n=1 Tax=Stappia sediminis TaxID=2692190 RepID=A0A7X3LRQ2_9HYPH|nr:nitroreductase [Stappia sediminis]MXN63882.1 nitroreductase [Stappia sediminis]
MTQETNDALRLLLTRRSHPAISLEGPAPDEETLNTLLTAASRVPDHGKLAPWRFLIIRGEARQRAGERLLAIAEQKNGPLGDDLRKQELERFSRAPLVVAVISRAAVHPKIPVWEQELSAGAVCMNLLTAAHAAGFAAQWLTEWPAFDPDVANLFGMQEGERFAGFVYIGRPTVQPAERPRPELSEIASTWTGE